MKMFEYLAAGRAIVSSDLPVLHEVLSDKTAVFCPPDDASSWCQTVRQLLDSSAKRNQMGAAAKKASLEYSWKRRAENALQGFVK